MTALYNEIDPKAAAWLRELIRRDLIAPGDVSEASIEDLNPDDLRRYTQVHFFAGIGVWSYALRRAGWPDDRPVWTGSCPCQPFSAAGKGGGFDDERHLWPAFYHLIRECGPDDVLGEQVASKDGLAWLDLVQADLEAAAYANGSVDFCSAGVGAPHIRQRLYWFGKRLADTTGEQRARQIDQSREQSRIGGQGMPAGGRLHFGGLGHDDDDTGLEGQRGRYQTESGRLGEVRSIATPSEPSWLDDFIGDGRGTRRNNNPRHDRFIATADVGLSGLADADGGNAGAERQQRGGEQRQLAQDDRSDQHGWGLGRPGPVNGFWGASDWLHCRDERWRPVEPGTFPLAHGAPARVGRLRGYGNAINAEAATAFVEAYLEAETDRRDLRLTSTYEITTDKDIFG